MKIEINLNGNNYAILVESNCYIPMKYSLNQKKDSENFGKQTESNLGYFSKLSNAASRIIREEITITDDVVSLREYAERIEALNSELKEQLQAVEI